MTIDILVVVNSLSDNEGYKFITKEDIVMEYTKPVVISTERVDAAKCGDGPCGRPCDQKA